MDVTIAYSTRKQTPKDFKTYFDANIKLIHVKNFTRNLHPWKDMKAAFEVRRIVKEEKPDMIHMHSSKAGAIGRLVISPKQAKLFYTPHSYAFCKKDDPKLKIKFYRMIETMLGKKQCITIACSKGEYEEAQKVTKNSMYVSNGIQLETIHQAILGKPEKLVDIKNLKICTVGRIGHQKNPEMFQKIAEKFPELTFTWIGDGELKEVLRSPNIVITGWQDRTTSLQQLYQNDVFLLPSLWEGLPITLLEAMYMKKICMVSNVMGNRDVIDSGENGFICETEREYCEKIEKIIKEEVDYKKIQNKAKEKILAEHSMDTMAEEYLKIYGKGDDCY